MANEMTMIARRPTHPGEVLREEYMPELGLSVAKLAAMLGVSRQSVNELVHERRSLSPDMALRLARLFDVSPQYWLNLQRNVDLWDTFNSSREAIESIQPLGVVAG